MARQSRPPSRRTAILASLVLVALVAGLVLVRLSRDPSSSDRSDPQASVGEQPGAPVEGSAGPVAEVDGVPVGFGEGQPGAVAAAIAYATASQRWLYFTDTEIEAAVTQIATPVAAPRLVEDVLTDVSMARDQLAKSEGPVWWIVRPLAWKVERFRESEARVSVWTVTVLSAAGVASPQSEFVTVTLDLSWLDGDWRVDGSADSAGPTPITGPQDQPWDAEPFDQALDGFTRVDGEAVK